MTHLVLVPAHDVTDLDEWFGRLDSAVALREDARWRSERGGIGAELPDGEAERVVRAASAALGTAVEICTLDGDDVVVTEAMAGRPIDE